jgi:beta-glucosidase
MLIAKGTAMKAHPSVFLILPLFLLLEPALLSAQEINNDIETNVRNLLSQMTLEEKIGQMTQIDFSVISAVNGQDLDDPIDQAKLDDALFNHHIGSILNTPSTPNNKAQPIDKWRRLTQTIRDTAAKTRLHIPVIYGIDAIHGATYTQNAVLFPQAINMAATFNPELSFLEGEITAKTVKASGLDWNFAPVMDIGRQPLWPRLWETYGEDVHLVSVMGSAYIKGHQDADFSLPGKAPTCLKHYVGYSFPINGKDRTPAWIGERMLREYFLPSFEAGIKAGAATIMVNSAEVDGIPGHANYQYLTTILRGELGFTGFTVSDWEDIMRLYSRDKLAASPKEAVKIAVMAGVDMSMVPFNYSFHELLLELVKDGEVPVSRIDEAVTRILRVKFQSGLFQRQTPALDVADNLTSPHALAVNQQAARESIVLAKNEQQILPLSKDAKILVTGPTANSLSVMNGGWTITWQGDKDLLYPQDKPTLLQALQAKGGNNISYVGGKHFTDEINIEQAVTEARKNDYIILALGEKPYTETMGNIETLNLDVPHLQLARALQATGKPIILVTFGGRPRVITEIAEQASAVVLGFLPGMEGGSAMADILYGDTNPSGKLPISYPRNTNDTVLYDYKPMEIFETNQYHPLFPFGHGLSYTSFRSSDLKLEKTEINDGEELKLSVKVKNTGSRTGKEVVMVYLHDVAASVTRPNKQLKAFKKVELKANEEQTLHFTLSWRDLSFIGVNMQRIVEPGEFTIMVGNETVSFKVIAANKKWFNPVIL